MRVQRLEPLLRADLDDDAPAAIEAPLQEPRQSALERLPLKVIEKQLSHG